MRDGVFGAAVLLAKGTPYTVFGQEPRQFLIQSVDSNRLRYLHLEYYPLARDRFLWVYQIYI